MSSSPTINASVSSNGLTWTPASKVSLSGYRLNIWLPNTPARYIKLEMTPSHPDNLGGSVYTFGVTDVSGTSVDYNLVSDLFFKPIVFPVRTSTARLMGSGDAGLTYYLTVSDGVDPRSLRREGQLERGPSPRRA